MAALVEKGDLVTLDPKPGFVVKTKIIDATNYNKYDVSTKVFINICHDAQVPQPNQEFDPQIVFPLIIDNQWEIPITTSCEKESKDKKGQPSLVYDCCINTGCFRWCQVNADLRSILIEWCLEAVEMVYEIILEREYTIPKMLSKGELTKTEILKSELEGSVEKKLEHMADERMGLIEDLREDEARDFGEQYETLPDIMNVGGGKRLKPVLIEEIDEAEIESKRKKYTDKSVIVGASAAASKPQEEPPVVIKVRNEEGALAEEDYGLKELKTMKISIEKQPRQIEAIDAADEDKMDIDEHQPHHSSTGTISAGQSTLGDAIATTMKESSTHRRITEVGWTEKYIPTVTSTASGGTCIKLLFPEVKASGGDSDDGSGGFAVEYVPKLSCVVVKSGMSSLQIQLDQVAASQPAFKSFWVRGEKAMYIFAGI